MLALVVLVLDGKAGVSSVLEVMLYGMGAVTTAAGFLAVVWRIARPHVLSWLEAQFRPIREDLEQVRAEVKPDHGDSLKDRAAAASEAATSADEKLDQLKGSVHRLGRQLDKVDARGQITKSVLDQHVSESSDYLRSIRGVFAEAGITLPDPRTVYDDEEPDL